jgi:hypothetical protein
MGIHYRRCLSCRTSYASPRPEKESLDRFYAESDAIQYWNENVARSTAQARRQYIFGPRATWVLETATLYGVGERALIDFYSKYPAFLHEIAERGRFSTLYTFKPSLAFEELASVPRLERMEQLEPGSAGVITAFEVLERLFDPYAYLQRLNGVLETGGIVLLTTTSISGFDLVLLRGKARNLLPPTHLTLLSYQGIHKLMERAGFEVVELSTPGQLDVAIVKDELSRDPDLQLPPVIDAILLRRSEGVQDAFQDFLQGANLSSHVWVAGKKG